MRKRARIATLSMMVALATTASGCHVLPTRLPERPIDDPVTLPAKMAWVEIDWGPRFPDPGSPRHWPITAGAAVALTPRLQLDLPLTLVYAVMEERPSDGRPAQPVTLAVGGGLRSFGFGTPVGGAWIEGELVARKHLGRRWRIDASFVVDAPTRFGPSAGTVGHGLSGHLGAVLQLGNRWILVGSVDGNTNNQRRLFAPEVGFLDGADGSRSLSFPITLRWRVCPGFDASIFYWETVQRTYYDPEFGAPLATPRSPSTSRSSQIALGGIFRW